MTTSHTDENRPESQPADTNYRQPDWDYSYAQSQGHDAGHPDEYHAAYPQPELPHSLWGVASFGLALLSVFGSFMLLGLCMLIISSDPELQVITKDPDGFAQKMENDPDSIPDFVNSPALAWIALIGLGMLACGFAQFIALVLGVVGLCQPRTRKVFSICGIIFSSAPFLFFMGLIVLGMIVSAAGM